MSKIFKISVITVLYNAKKYLESTIKSMIKNKTPNVEYIVIDGKSTDGSIDIIKKYLDNIDHFVSEPDNGMYDGLNKGIKLAKGDIIGQINADDYYAEGALQKVIDIYKETNFDLFYGNTLIIDQQGNIVSKKTARKWENIYYGNPEFLHSACFFSRSILDKVGYYNPKYKIAGDIDLLQRVYLNTDKDKVVYKDVDISYQRIGGMSQHKLGWFRGYKEYKKISIENGCKRTVSNYYFYKKTILRIIFIIRDFLLYKLIKK